MEDRVYTIFEILGISPELYACIGCGQAYRLHEFKVNKARFGEYCKSCQRILGRAAMRKKHTLHSKLEEIQAALKQRGTD